jgi:hypothetical protein
MVGVTLRDWYGASAMIYKATLNRQCERHFLSPGDPYPIGTVVDVYIDDPERPGMADVQLPNGDLLRMMATDVTLVASERDGNLSYYESR